jgi:SAM-dependent methyltransferase
LKKLAESQVESFDTVYVVGTRWDVVKARIDRDFPTGDFHLLDLGGGNGAFTDAILEAYPAARGTVIDNSNVLLARNRSHKRKTLVCESVENLDSLQEKFDIICAHWLLHHLIGDSYAETRRNQMLTLQCLPRFLTPNGRISLFENMCNGWLIDNLPAYMTYQFTSARAIAAITRRMGANTAGVGVCYLSKVAWFNVLENVGLEILDYCEPDNWVWPVRPEWRILLHVGDMRVGHFWLRAPGPQA